MTIAFLGDSITLGYALEDKSARYSTLVAAELGMDEENYGITGTLVAKAGLNESDGLDFVSRLHLIERADVAIIFGGTNDYFWSDKGIFGETDSYFATAFDTVCRFVKEKRADKITLTVTPYPHNGIGNFLGGGHWRLDKSRHDTSEKNYTGNTLSDYAAVIRETSARYSIPCLDLFDSFPFDHRIHTSDGCHPNEAGHRLLCDFISRKLREIMQKA